MEAGQPLPRPRQWQIFLNIYSSTRSCQSLRPWIQLCWSKKKLSRNVLLMPQRRARRSERQPARLNRRWPPNCLLNPSRRKRRSPFYHVRQVTLQTITRRTYCELVLFYLIKWCPHIHCVQVADLPQLRTWATCQIHVDYSKLWLTHWKTATQRKSTNHLHLSKSSWR